MSRYYENLVITLYKYLSRGNSLDSLKTTKLIYEHRSFNQNEFVTHLSILHIRIIGPANPVLYFKMQRYFDVDNPTKVITLDEFLTIVELMAKSKKSRLFDWIWTSMQVQSKIKSEVSSTYYEQIDKYYTMKFFNLESNLSDKNFQESAETLMHYFKTYYRNANYEIRDDFWNKYYSNYGSYTAMINCKKSFVNFIWLCILHFTVHNNKEQKIANAVFRLYYFSERRSTLYKVSKRQKVLMIIFALWILCYKENVKFDDMDITTKHFELSEGKPKIYEHEDINIPAQVNFPLWVKFDFFLENVSSEWEEMSNNWRGKSIDMYKEMTGN